MPQLPEVVPESVPISPSSRWQSLASMLLLFLAVVAAPSGRRDIAAAAAQLVQWLTGEPPAPADPPRTPTPLIPSPQGKELQKILEAAETKLLEQQRKIEEQQAQLNSLLATATTAESTTAGTAPAAETQAAPVAPSNTAPPTPLPQTTLRPDTPPASPTAVPASPPRRQGVSKTYQVTTQGVP
jgi:hypothetical protein